MTIALTVTTVAGVWALSGWLAMSTALSHNLFVKPLHLSTLLPGAIATVLAALLASHHQLALGRSIVIAGAAVAAATDLQTGYIFDRVLALDALLVLVADVVTGNFIGALFGGALAGGLLLLPWICSRGRGVGLGDVKLAAVIGLGLGVNGALTAVWFSVVSGGAAAAFLLMRRHVGGKSEMRFAPFLALGTGCALLWDLQ